MAPDRSGELLWLQWGQGGKRNNTRVKWIKVQEHVAHTDTDTHLHLKAGAPKRASHFRRSRFCFKRAHFAFRTFHTVQSGVEGKNCSCSCAPICIDNQIHSQHQFYVSLQVEHDNINTPSDIVHYVGHGIISFMASNAGYQYSWVLYHDYDCRGAEMLSASHYGRVKWINIPEEAESGVQCACVWADSPGRSECTNAEGFMRRLISPSYTYLFLIAVSTDFWSEQHFWLRNKYTDSISACDRFLSPSCVGYKLRNAIFLQQHSRQAGQPAGWNRSFAWSHLSEDLQAVCDRELRCLFSMRSA